MHKDTDGGACYWYKTLHLCVVDMLIKTPLCLFGVVHILDGCRGYNLQSPQNSVKVINLGRLEHGVCFVES